MVALAIKNLNKSYSKGNKIFDDFNVSFDTGELIVILGPSGCGKSTLLRSIAGLEEIESGEIDMDGVNIANIDPKDRQIAMVFQNYALYPHKTVYGNLEFGLKMRKVDKETRQKRIEQVAEMLGLTPFLQRKPKALSGGQRQRVALGRALVNSPKLFLMDEPLSNLDAKLRVKMRSEIIQLHKQLDETIIYVTHDQTEAMTMADRILLLNQGEIQQFDRPEKLYHEPANLFTAEFIGSPAMNILSLPVENQQVQLLNQTFKLPFTYDKSSIYLGIRPEDVTLTSDGEQPILYTENLGNEYLIIVNYQGKEVVIRSDRDYPTNGKYGLSLNPDKLHWFDQDTQLRRSEL